jgi:DNA polymerase alpha subunit A
MLAERSAEGSDEGTASGNSSVPELLRCPNCTQEGCLQRLSPGMLVNQVKQRADEFISRYYDGVMCCDEDSCGQVTRNVSLRVAGDAERGTVCPNYPRCNGRLGRQYTEVHLYKQLTHFYRLLDASRALDNIAEANARLAAEVKLATVRPAFDWAAQAVKDIRDRSGYRWVQLGAFCVSVS